MSPARSDAKGIIIACPACGRANRLAYASLRKPARCGHCHTALPPPAVPVEVADTGTFDAMVEQSALPVLVDFWAPWCGPCRMVAPELERVAAQASGELLVIKVNTDQLTDVAARFQVRSIPTLGLLHRGVEIDRLAGARPAADIIRFAREATSGRRAS
jgi:thioredoxin 2